MISLAKFLGGCDEVALNSNKAIKHTAHRIQVVTPDVGGRTLTLPDARLMHLGGPAFYILSVDHGFFVKDSAGGAIVTVQFGEQAVVIGLFDNITAAGGWFASGP